MLAEVKKRLQSLGYTPAKQDEWPLRFVIQKVEQDIRNGTNQDAVPAGLRHIAVDMAAGEFLLAKKATPEGLTGFDLEQAAKSISLGDTKVDFGDGGSTQEQRLDAIIKHLMRGKRSYAAFRRIQW